jgi:hypothetical protein
MEASVGSLSVVMEASAIDVVPGESYFGRNQYIEYLAGDMPLVLSAPHGGDREPAEIDDRTTGVMGAELNTRDLALRIREAVREQTGSHPHLVISHLHRSKLDPNREIVEAAQGDPEAERAWWEFQTFIHQAEVLVEEDFGEGLYIDLHGHGHEIQRLELGYLLSATDLAAPDELLSGPAFSGKSSFKALASKPDVDFTGLIRGPFSLGTLLEARGVQAVPSENQPHPGSDPYFSGGYNTLMHGSRDSGTVSGVQIECNYTGIRDTDTNREAFAQLLAGVLTEFYPVWFGWELGGLSEIPFGIVTETRSY